eukprot:GDKH01019086.1.p1 GENE.GDKH01019086.1~~GDKH01019086.1.p1  ORF type:complete len:266 (+),score=2.27 GDKH01019086.1:97-894(+)
MVALFEMFSNVASWYAQSLRESFAHYGVGTFFCLLLSWTSYCVLFELLCMTGKLEPFRLQPKEKTSGRVWWDGVYNSLRSWRFVLVSLLPSAPLLKLAFPVEVDTVFSFTDYLLFWAWCLVLFDLWFYIYHRTLHYFPELYRRYHKPHHHYTATFVWMSHAQHPVEIILNSIGAVVPPLLYSWWLMPSPSGGPSVSLHMLWFLLMHIQLFGVLDHCGYGLPINPMMILKCPFFIEVKEHDEHHRRLNVAYGAYLGIWDYLGGTAA